MSGIIICGYATEHFGATGHVGELHHVSLLRNAGVHRRATAILRQSLIDGWIRFDADALPAAVSLEEQGVGQANAIMGADVQKEPAYLLPQKFIDEQVLAILR